MMDFICACSTWFTIGLQKTHVTKKAAFAHYELE